MYYQEFHYWCRDAVKKIKYYPDKVRVYSELHDHMMDRYEGFLARGMTEQEAEEKTLAAMGDPKELAPQLAAIHKPFWGYAVSITRFLACVMLCLALGRSVFFIHEVKYMREKDLWDPLTAQPTAYVTPDVKDSSDGYTFSAEKAALLQDGQLYLRLKVTNPLPWAPEQQALRWMWAVDSTGTYYVSSAETNPNTDSFICISSQRIGLTTYLYDLYFQGTAETMQWVELHYDREGRDVVLHVDLTGGDT